MLVPDLLFDIILFGTLIAASVLDLAFPSLGGAALLFAVGAATYIAAQEFCDGLQRSKWWTQESLATSLSLSTGGFIYYWWRNNSDLSLLVLSIGLMMASLMIAIALIACLNAVFKDLSPRPLGGLVLTLIGSLALGLLAGLLTLNASIYTTLIVMVSLALWKLRENVRPPAQNALSQESAPGLGNAAYISELKAAASHTATPPMTIQPLAHPSGRWMLVPQRGTLLDRFLPVLVLGALVCLAIKGVGPSAQRPSSAASASNATPNNTQSQPPQSK